MFVSWVFTILVIIVMNNIKLSDYGVEIHEVGYFVFLDFVQLDTKQTIRIETNKEELKDMIHYLNKYLNQENE